MDSRSRNALVGFGGGLVGGLTAMPGALPAIWCDIHGFQKNQQRGLVQPYIAIMQCFALALMLSHQSLSLKVLIDFGLSLPALAWNGCGYRPVRTDQRNSLQTNYPGPVAVFGTLPCDLERGLRGKV